MPDEPQKPAEEQETGKEESAERASTQSGRRIPAVYCDAYGISTWQGHVRISLGEYFDHAYYRTAIVMTNEDARSLAKDLLRLIERQEEDDAKKAREEKEAADKE